VATAISKVKTSFKLFGLPLVAGLVSANFVGFMHSNDLLFYSDPIAAAVFYICPLLGIWFGFATLLDIQFRSNFVGLIVSVAYLIIVTATSFLVSFISLWSYTGIH